MFHTAVLGWFSFWATYWLVEGVLPYDERSLSIVPSQPVPQVVARNMLLSLPYAILILEITPDIGIYLPASYIIRFIISAIIMDGWFYLVHRLLHHKLFYRWHKQHHQFYVPYPLVAVYSSPLEALLCDATAMGLGPSLLKMSGLELEIWMVLAAIHSLVIHSSLVHARSHNVHHGTNTHNFGLLSLFDRLFGTYK